MSQEQSQVELELTLLEALEIYPPVKLRGKFSLKNQLLFLCPNVMIRAHKPLPKKKGIIFPCIQSMTLICSLASCFLLMGLCCNVVCRHTSPLCSLWSDGISWQKVCSIPLTFPEFYYFLLICLDLKEVFFYHP